MKKRKLKKKSRLKGVKKKSKRTKGDLKEAILAKKEACAKKLTVEEIENAYLAYKECDGSISKSSMMANVHRNTMARLAAKGVPKKGILPFEQRVKGITSHKNKKADRDAKAMATESLAMIKNLKSKVWAGLKEVEKFKFSSGSAAQIMQIIDMVTRLEQSLMGEADKIIRVEGEIQHKIKLPPQVLEHLANEALLKMHEMNHMPEQIIDAEIVEDQKALPAPKKKKKKKKSKV